MCSTLSPLFVALVITRPQVPIIESLTMLLLFVNEERIAVHIKKNKKRNEAKRKTGLAFRYIYYINIPFSEDIWLMVVDCCYCRRAIDRTRMALDCKKGNSDRRP